jgi:hypothetical protein
LSGFRGIFSSELVAPADCVSTLIEGGIIMNRVLEDKNVLVQQIMLGRDYVKRVFDE